MASLDHARLTANHLSTAPCELTHPLPGDHDLTQGDQGEGPLVNWETAWIDPAIQIWNRSFLENLHYAVDADTSERTGTVLDMAELRPLLQKLPQGLQTYLGEGGALLSGGEGQRVRLARALMQSRTRLALLDEPFRGMDREQRTRLLCEARAWWKDATLLCVTHDVSETLAFDRVLVIEDGRIVEDGAPSRLASSASRYRELLDAEQNVRNRMWNGKQWRRIHLENGRVEGNLESTRSRERSDIAFMPRKSRRRTEAAHVMEREHRTA